MRRSAANTAECDKVSYLRPYDSCHPQPDRKGGHWSKDSVETRQPSFCHGLRKHRPHLPIVSARTDKECRYGLVTLLQIDAGRALVLCSSHIQMDDAVLVRIHLSRASSTARSTEVLRAGCTAEFAVSDRIAALLASADHATPGASVDASRTPSGKSFLSKDCTLLTGASRFRATDLLVGAK